MSELMTYGESHASAPNFIGVKNKETTFTQKRSDMHKMVYGFAERFLGVVRQHSLNYIFNSWKRINTLHGVYCKHHVLCDQ